MPLVLFAEKMAWKVIWHSNKTKKSNAFSFETRHVYCKNQIQTSLDIRCKYVLAYTDAYRISCCGLSVLFLRSFREWSKPKIQRPQILQILSQGVKCCWTLSYSPELFFPNPFFKHFLAIKIDRSKWDVFTFITNALS